MSSIPFVLSIFVQLLQMTSNLFYSKFMDEVGNYTAAIGLANVILNCSFTPIYVGINQAISLALGRSFGEKNFDQMYKDLEKGGIVLLLMFVIQFIFIMLLKPLLLILGQDE